MSRRLLTNNSLSGERQPKAQARGLAHTPCLEAQSLAGSLHMRPTHPSMCMTTLPYGRCYLRPCRHPAVLVGSHPRRLF